MSIGLLLSCCVALIVCLYLLWLVCIRLPEQRFRRKRAGALLQKLYAKMMEAITHSGTFITVASEQSLERLWETFFDLHTRLESINDNAMLLRFEAEVDRLIAQIEREAQFVHTPSTIDEEIEKRKALLSEAEEASAQKLAEAEQQLEETRAQLARDLEVERRRVAGLIDYLIAAKAKLVE
jgi:hypothetical protein